MENLLIKRIGIFISSLITLIFIINFMEGNTQYILLFAAFLYLISCFLACGKYIQVGCLYFSSILSIYLNISFGYTISEIIILVFLSQKYGFISKKFSYKMILMIILYIIIFSICFYSHPLPLRHTLTTILFSSICVTFLYFIIIDNRMITKGYEKELNDKIYDLKKSLEEKDRVLSCLETDFIDPVEAGLTKAELLLLKNLCIYQESNVALGNRLKKSEYTIKNQLRNILLKIGAEDRHQLVDICKNYFLTLNK